MLFFQVIQVDQFCLVLCFQVVQAVQFLHELGSLQHFTNDFLKDQVVINPQWIVDVMACVVSVKGSAIKVSGSSGCQLFQNYYCLLGFGQEFGQLM